MKTALLEATLFLENVAGRNSVEKKTLDKNFMSGNMYMYHIHKIKYMHQICVMRGLQNSIRMLKKCIHILTLQTCKMKKERQN